MTIKQIMTITNPSLRETLLADIRQARLDTRDQRLVTYRNTGYSYKKTMTIRPAGTRALTEALINQR